MRPFQVENCNISCISLRSTLEKILIFARKVGGPEIGPAHKEQKMGGPGPIGSAASECSTVREYVFIDDCSKFHNSDIFGTGL